MILRLEVVKTKSASEKLLFKFRPLPAITLAAVMAVCAAQAKANTIALDFTGGARTFAPLDITAGWAFSLTAPIFLTDLGIWDGPNDNGSVGDGLAQSHPITIWTDSGVFVTSAIVPAGGGMLVGDFRYVSIASLFLPAGDYVIAAFYEGEGPDPLISNADTVTTASGVTYSDSRSASGNGFPSFDSGDRPNSYFGPNFQFTTVPEPGLTALLMLGLVGGLFARRMLWHKAH
jgi:hypothetical protein